jgi:hypothetical protein
MPHRLSLLSWYRLSLLFGLAIAAGLPAQLTTIRPATAAPQRSALIVGFMGGRVKSTNLIHKEAVIAHDLQQRNGSRVSVLTFANHDAGQAMRAVLHYLDVDRNGSVDASEKQNARIVLYGHSWGASETVNMARQLGRIGVPVLLTIQVDSVQKPGEDDSIIPANVHRAMNIYQTEGLLNGRRAIRAADATQTHILGNRRVSYKHAPVDTSQFPWFARTFMHSHIEIENDPTVWASVQNLIQEEVDATAATPPPD